MAAAANQSQRGRGSEDSGHPACARRHSHLWKTIVARCPRLGDTRSGRLPGRNRVAKARWPCRRTASVAAAMASGSPSQRHRPDGAPSLVELVHDGDAGRDLELAVIVAASYASRCLISARRLLPWAATRTDAGQQVGGDGVEPVRDHADHDVGQAFGGGHHAGARRTGGPTRRRTGPPAPSAAEERRSCAATA